MNKWPLTTVSLSRRAARLSRKGGLRVAEDCNMWLGTVAGEKECHKDWNSFLTPSKLARLVSSRETSYLHL